MMMHPLRFLSGAALALVTVAGCDAYVEPAQAPPPPPVAYTETTSAPAPPEAEGDVVYVQDAPVDDIDSYPVAVYGGVNVYFVGGTWYRHDARGWGEYQHEPPQLAQERERHDRDPQWQRARESRPAPRARPVDPPNVDRDRRGQGRDEAPRAQPVQSAPPARMDDGRMAPRAPEAAPQRQPEEAPAQQAPRGRPPVKHPAPVRQPAPHAEPR